MTAVERHAVYQIRVDLKANKDPLGKVSRKRTSEVAALQSTVGELSDRVVHYPGNRTENDHGRGQGQYPDETYRRSNKNQPGLVRQSYSEKKQKGLGDWMNTTERHAVFQIRADLNAHLYAVNGVLVRAVFRSEGGGSTAFCAGAQCPCRQLP